MWIICGTPTAAALFNFSCGFTVLLKVFPDRFSGWRGSLAFLEESVSCHTDVQILCRMTATQWYSLCHVYHQSLSWNFQKTGKNPGRIIASSTELNQWHSQSWSLTLNFTGHHNMHCKLPYKAVRVKQGLLLQIALTTQNGCNSEGKAAYRVH